MAGRFGQLAIAPGDLDKLCKAEPIWQKKIDYILLKKKGEQQKFYILYFGEYLSWVLKFDTDAFPMSE